MPHATLTSSLASDRARQRMESSEGGPFLVCDWQQTLFIHYQVSPEVLAPLIPFELDTRDGLAYVSLVAFTMRHMRLSAAGRILEWITAPIANHPFLNVRTYVRHHGEPGIYFLAEWLSNALAVPLGRRFYGLPYHHGHLRYQHDPLTGLHGEVTAAYPDRHSLRYHVSSPIEDVSAPAPPDSLEEFLVERYAAFTHHRSIDRRFRVWHAPWSITPIDIQIDDQSLLELTGPWHNHARRIGAHFSPGVFDVWMGRPACVIGPSCSTVWQL